MARPRAASDSPRVLRAPAEGKRSFIAHAFDSSAATTTASTGCSRSARARGTGDRRCRAPGSRPGCACSTSPSGPGSSRSEAVRILGDAGGVVGIDPSAGMMAASTAAELTLVRGRAEALPFAAGAFDFLSLGFALRHSTTSGGVPRVPPGAQAGRTPAPARDHAAREPARGGAAQGLHAAARCRASRAWSREPGHAAPLPLLLGHDRGRARRRRRCSRRSRRRDSRARERDVQLGILSEYRAVA